MFLFWNRIKKLSTYSQVINIPTIYRYVVFN